ncbi:hypothetical protein ITJ42_05060 [Clavibacter michiganensis subsp. phaseoli]|uniref:Uncharacterized protein n=1 Tax=Clavibacter phaseoli TaxID=1734031 RepID=A0A8I0VGK8_9MICO|nr:hypothetical protein [Clavibacter phaseoli]MBF4630574.1 hypothetical protein [Clavibacter phaseoli]
MNEPYDVVGSVLVPVAAILVSTLVAYFLARHERRSADRARLAEYKARYSEVLSDVASTAVVEDEERSLEARQRLVGLTNVMYLVLPERDHIVIQFIFSASSEAAGKGDFKAIQNAGVWCVNAWEAWSRGRLQSADFEKAYPQRLRDKADDAVDLFAWDQNTSA